MATVAFLSVEINGKQYGIETLEAAGTLNKVVRLTQNDGQVYDVEQGWNRTTCTCKDFQFRHADLPFSEGCKHVKALVELNLIANVAPWESEEIEEAPAEIGVTGEWFEAGSIEATQGQHAGLALAVAELADDAVNAERGEQMAPTRRKAGRKPVSDTINWDSYGRRYAAGESHRALAAEAGIPRTRFLNRMNKFGYQSPCQKIKAYA